MPGQRRLLELLERDAVVVVTSLDRLSYFVSDLELLLPGAREEDNALPSVASLHEGVTTNADWGTCALAEFLDGAAAQRSRRRRKLALYRPSLPTFDRLRQASPPRRAALLEGAMWESTAHLGRARDSAERRTLLNQPRGRATLAARPELVGRVLRMRKQGTSLREIARELNHDEVSTMRGGTIWRASALQRLCNEQAVHPLDCKPEDDLPL